RPDHFAAAGLFFSAIGALSFLSFLKRSCAGFWFLWIVIWLLPVLTFIPVPVADRHLYLPVLGLSGLILSLFEKRGRALIVFLCALNLFFGVRTVQRLKIWKNSETLWKSVLETYPDHHRANLLLADAYGEDQHDDQAIAIYQKLIRNYPEDALAYVNLSNLFLALGRTQEAKKTVQEMEAKTYAAPYDLYALRAGIAHLEGHSDESLEYLEKAVRAASPDSSVYYTLGRLYFSKQNWTGAAAMFEETVRLNPALPEAYYFCALTHNILKHWDRALHYLKLMHEQDMHHSGLLLQEGYAYFNLGQLPQARQAYLQNLDRDPGSADAYFHLGLIALRQNQKDEAIHYFQQAVSLDPESGQYRKVLQQSLSSANPS
ncbi:MAG: tetratricopeptide repeat protein, partial [Candidatus Omnitrophica bacterium]|nr:tetratricopeptide repeat protein [Candidatus Omnitrophota bacterium]